MSTNDSWIPQACIVAGTTLLTVAVVRKFSDQFLTPQTNVKGITLVTGINVLALTLLHNFCNHHLKQSNLKTLGKEKLSKSTQKLSEKENERTKAYADLETAKKALQGAEHNREELVERVEKAEAGWNAAKDAYKDALEESIQTSADFYTDKYLSKELNILKTKKSALDAQKAYYQALIANQAQKGAKQRGIALHKEQVYLTKQIRLSSQQSQHAKSQKESLARICPDSPRLCELYKEELKYLYLQQYFQEELFQLEKRRQMHGETNGVILKALLGEIQVSLGRQIDFLRRKEIANKQDYKIAPPKRDQDPYPIKFECVIKDRTDLQNTLLIESLHNLIEISILDPKAILIDEIFLLISDFPESMTLGGKTRLEQFKEEMTFIIQECFFEIERKIHEALSQGNDDSLSEKCKKLKDKKPGAITVLFSNFKTEHDELVKEISERLNKLYQIEKILSKLHVDFKRRKEIFSRTEEMLNTGLIELEKLLVEVQQLQNPDYTTPSRPEITLSVEMQNCLDDCQQRLVSAENGLHDQFGRFFGHVNPAQLDPLKAQFELFIAVKKERFEPTDANHAKTYEARVKVLDHALQALDKRKEDIENLRRNNPFVKEEEPSFPFRVGQVCAPILPELLIAIIHLIKTTGWNIKFASINITKYAALKTSIWTFAAYRIGTHLAENYSQRPNQ